MKLSLPLLMLLSVCTFSSHAADLNATTRLPTDLPRDATSHPLETLKLLQLKPGMQVLDLLGGGGYFSELMAQDVGPTGTVYLHNNQAYMAYVGKDLTARFANNRLPNVKDWRKEISTLDLPANSLDAVLFVMGYHDLYYVDKDWPKIDETQLMNQLKAALKPGGYLLVIDHVAAAGTGVSAAQTLHRIDPEFAKQQLIKQGFQFVSAHSFLANPNDPHQKLVFDPSVKGKTDRFVFLLQKPKN